MWTKASIPKLISAEKLLIDEGTDWAHKCLLRLRFYKWSDTQSPVECEKRMVNIEKSRQINTLSFRAANLSDDEKRNLKRLLFCSGYACGAAIYSRVASAFVARNPTYQVDCIDWIGWGLSTHPSDMIVSRKDFMGSIKEFTSCLEEWRRAEQLPKLTFFAHSLGGYLSTWYARTYPTNVERLVLLSAIGQPDKPDEETIKARRSTLPFWAKLLMNSASCLVNTFGMTPMTPLRIAGPWGPNATKGWVERRFSANCLEPLPPSFDDYLYNFNALPSCGEGIVTVCLDTTAHAHYPMSDWLLNDQGKFEGIANTVDELPPITFVHGQQDWVRPDVAFLASKKHPHRVNTFILEKSGHQLFIENPKGFTAMMEWVLNSHPGQLQPNMPPMFEAPPPMRQSDK